MMEMTSEYLDVSYAVKNNPELDPNPISCVFTMQRMQR